LLILDDQCKPVYFGQPGFSSTLSGSVPQTPHTPHTPHTASSATDRETISSRQTLSNSDKDRLAARAALVVDD
jgi:hypothetical protein